MKREQYTPRSLGTHDGTFHADEVTACALLLLMDRIDEEKIVRSRDPIALKKCEYICDVGGSYDPGEKIFDHHQASYDGPLSSAGMILEYLRDQGGFSEQEYDYIAHNLVIGIDAVDNGYSLPEGFCTFSQVISTFTPIQQNASPQEEEKSFHQAVQFTKQHLQRLRDRFTYLASCQEKISRVMKRDKECLFFDEEISWQDGFFALGGEKHPALFLIMPTGQHWKLRGIPPSARERMQVRMPLPEAWAGLLQGDLQRVSGIPGAIFCHKGRFVSVWETREDAVKALECATRKKESA